jgi:hexosaminidase
MSHELLLAPMPRQLSQTGRRFTLPADALIALRGLDPQALLFTAGALRRGLADAAGVEWDIVAGEAAPLDQVGVELSIVPGVTPTPEGYNLTITAERIMVVGSAANGVFYGVQTLCQLLRAYGASLPTLRCSDWPDFPNRGVMLDVSRDKVPTLETVMDLVDLLAGFKINQLQLYTEHTFAYRRHPAVWADASPFTGEEILALDAYCRARFIELVPNQNTFGHLHHWLEHPAYRHLAEAPDGAQTSWGFFDPRPFSLAPVLPESLDLVRDMLDELLPHFTSRQVNVGGDETYDVGQGKSKELAEQIGKERVYLDFMLKIHREVSARGYAMQFWGDIIMEHPELVPELPRDVIAMEWGYEADHPFDEHGARFAASGVPFYVVPGASGWNSVAGRTDNALENLRNAAANGAEHGAIGYLITEWGDRGHWQPLPVAYPAFLYGAALAWARSANVGLDVAAALDRFVFADAAGLMGRTVYELGNAYAQTSVKIHNMSVLFAILQSTPDEFAANVKTWWPSGDPAQELRAALAFVEERRRALAEADLQCGDGALIVREITWCAEMLGHACRRGLWLLTEAGAQSDEEKQALAADLTHLLDEHQAIWHLRNRSGGFDDSQARLARLQEDYV